MKLNHCISRIAIGFILGARVSSAICSIAIDFPAEDRNGKVRKPTKSDNTPGKGEKAGKKGTLNLVNFSTNCIEATDVTISLPGKSLAFTMDKAERPIAIADGPEISRKVNMFTFGKGEKGSTLNLLQTPNGQLFGSITDTADDTVTQIGVDADGNNYVDITPTSEFPPEAEPFDTLGLMDGNPFQERFLSKTARRVSNAEVTIDVLVVWTKNAECAHSKLAKQCQVNNNTMQSMISLIELAIFETNVAYKSSGVQIKLELVHSYRSETYDEPEPSSDSFRQSLFALSGKNDGELDEVHQLRELHGADIVAMIVDDNQYCGMGYYGPSINSMFSITKWSCATGYYSFGHEIGHNMGLSHDMGAMNQCGSDDYNFAYRDPDGDFRTVMAYNCRKGECDGNTATGCPRIQMFSTPHLTHETTGKNVGTEHANNVRMLNENKDLVADFFHRPKTSDCINNDSYQFTANNGETNKCIWITKNYRKIQKRRKTYCSRKDVSDNCKLACSECLLNSAPAASPVTNAPTTEQMSCQDSSTFTFELLNTKMTKIQDCAWLTKQNVQKRLNKYCERNYSGTLVKHACRDSCDNCNE